MKLRTGCSSCLALLFACAGDSQRGYAPVFEVSGEELVTVSDTEAALTWVTDTASDTKVHYGEGMPDRVADCSGKPTRFHYCEIGGLEPGTPHTYVVESGGKLGRPTEHSPGAFTTLVPPPGRLLFRFATLNDSHAGNEESGLVCILPDVCINEGFSWPDPENPFWEFTSEDAVRGMNERGADFAIHKGDVSTYFEPWEFEEAKKILDALGPPLTILRGNHDRMGFDGVDSFREIFGIERTWGSFEKEGSHLFVWLDSSNPWIGTPEVSEEQFAWLEETLDRHPGWKVWTFLHHAATDEAAGFAIPAQARERLASLLASHGGSVGVFSGHSHRAKVTHSALLGRVPFVETPATQEYPSGYCIYRVYEGGYIQTFYKTTCPECLEWSEMTKGEYWGRAPDILFGQLEERNFTYLFEEGGGSARGERRAGRVTPRRTAPSR